MFLNHEGDLFRTRLTHSLEVAQLARSMARALGLNEDLVEAISLAHDLGHTPFGHAGQDALNDCVRRADPLHEGFEHNLQSLRVVDELEQRYPRHDGLNLTFETREGILKHCSERNARRLQSREPGGVAERFLNDTRPSLEAQLCNLADEIAYNAHDVDDGVRSGLLSLQQLGDVPLLARHREASLLDHPQLGAAASAADSRSNGRRLLYDTIRRMLSAQVYDVIAATGQALADAAPADADAARRAPPLVQFSAAMRHDSRELKRFLHERLYRHPQVVEVTGRAQGVVRDLFEAYANAPELLPQDRAPASPRHLHRAVIDYIAGMTDRFALKEHQRLTGRVVF